MYSILIDMIDPPVTPKTVKQGVKTFKGDMYEVKTLYALTLNPTDEKQYFNAGDDRLRYVCRYIYNELISKLDKDVKIMLVPEISHPKGNNFKKAKTRIHFHGTILFKTKEVLLKYYLYIYNAFVKKNSVEVDTIDNKETWFNYIYKNKKAMSMFCMLCEIPYKIKTGMEKYKNDMTVIDEKLTYIDDGIYNVHCTYSKKRRK